MVTGAARQRPLPRVTGEPGDFFALNTRFLRAVLGAREAGNALLN